MTRWDKIGQGGRAAVVAGVIAVIAGLAYFGLAPSKAPVIAADGGGASAPVTATGAASSASGEKPAGTAESTSAPEPTTAAVGPASGQGGGDATPAVPAPGPDVPAFDLVRVAPDGSTLVAGRSTAAASIEVLVDDVKAATATGDANGKFVVQFVLPSSDRPRVVTLKEILPDGEQVTSVASVIVAPSGATVAGVAGNTAVDGTSTPSVAAAAPQGATPQPGAAGAQSASTATGAEAASPGLDTPAVTEQSPSAGAAGQGGSTDVNGATPTAPTVLLADKGGVSVLQTGGANSPDKTNLGINSIAYSQAGEVELSGHAVAGSNVRIYINNAPTQTAKVAANGSWTLTLPGIDAGVYTLRADQVDSAGKVTSRFETPFKRESPEVLAKAGLGKTGSVGIKAAIITVQPGYTLWGIARSNYGKGLMFVKVFEANQDQIRNPNLIYPGQVFSVPASN